MAVVKQDNLMEIKTSIEDMSKFHQIKVLELLSANKELTINENKNGVFINLSDLDADTLNKLKQYVAYVDEQEKDLNKQEEKKNQFKETFFTDTEQTAVHKTKAKIKIAKGNKDNITSSTTPDDSQVVTAE